MGRVNAGVGGIRQRLAVEPRHGLPVRDCDGPRRPAGPPQVMVAWRGWFDAGFDLETQPSANRSHRIVGRRSEPRRALAARSAARRRGGRTTLPRAQPPRFPLRAPTRGGWRDTAFLMARGHHCHHPHRRRHHRRRGCSRPSRAPEDHRPRWRRRVRRRRPRRQHPPRAGGRRRPRGRRAGSSRVAAASATKFRRTAHPAYRPR